MAPYRELDIKTIRRMMQRKSVFLSVYCRGVLDTEYTESEIQMLDGPLEVGIRGYAYLNFTHRIIFDYMKTQEMSELLNKHTPPGFCDVDFRVKLTIAEAKIAYSSCTVEGKVEVVRIITGREWKRRWRICVERSFKRAKVRWYDLLRKQTT
jgi:hypothetical protein